MGLDAVVVADDGTTVLARRIGAFHRVRGLQQALLRSGAERRFGVVAAEVPDGNHGRTQPDRAAAMLEELAWFEQLDGVWEEHVLVDAGTGDEVWTHVAAEGGQMAWSSEEGIALGLDEVGFFVRSLDGEHELFRSRAFRQVLAAGSHDHPPANAPVTFRDDASGSAFRCRCPVTLAAGREPGGHPGNGQARWYVPETLRVDVVPGRVEDHRAIVDALRDVSRAAVRTGRPITWT